MRFDTRPGQHAGFDTRLGPWTGLDTFLDSQMGLVQPQILAFCEGPGASCYTSTHG